MCNVEKIEEGVEVEEADSYTYHKCCNVGGL